MKLVLAAAMLAALVSPAVAGDHYDRQLEAQVKRIVAAKIGEIRGTLPYDKVLVFPAAEQVSESPSIRTLQSLPVSAEPYFQVIE
ncbi:MAG: hypothetical protein ACTHLC_14970 [Rhizobiaceae bacterium]